jgi:hypothetical protein
VVPDPISVKVYFFSRTARVLPGAVDVSVEGVNNLWITRLTVSTNSHGEVLIRSSTEAPSQGVRASSQHHNLSGPL